MNEKLIGRMLAFRDERDWAQFHNPKDLAIALSIEAAELLENFQWKTSPEAVGLNRDKMADELADVLIYAVYLADALGVDIGDAVSDKLRKNEAKYPVDKAFGRKEKYTEL